MRKAWENAQDDLEALRPVEKGQECDTRFWEDARHYSNYKKKVPPDLGGLHVYAVVGPPAVVLEEVLEEVALEDVQVRMCAKEVLEVSVEERGPAEEGACSFTYGSACAAGPEADKGSFRDFDVFEIFEENEEKGSARTHVDDRGLTQSASGLSMKTRPDGITSAPGTARISSCFKKPSRMWRMRGGGSKGRRRAWPSC